MTKGFLENRSPWRHKGTPPARIYFTDEALPPDVRVAENLDCSYLLRGLWPESTKKWFFWDNDEEPRVIKVAAVFEKLCEDYDSWCREKVAEFVKFKAPYDKKKLAGKYVDPQLDWPFDPYHPREINLPADLPALYALLCRFHDWMPGFDQLFSAENPAVEEFRSHFSSPDFEQQFEQRPVDIEELEIFLGLVKKDIEENHICRQAENRKIPSEDVLPDEREKPGTGEEIVVKLSKPQADLQSKEEQIARNKVILKNTSAETSNLKQRQLSASRQLALNSFVQALCENEVLVKAKLADIYNWIMKLENLQNDKNPYKGVREKPKKKNWESYLRQACKHYGTSTDVIREKAEKEWLYEKSKGHDVVYAINIDYHSSQQLD